MDIQEQGCWLALVFKSNLSVHIVNEIITNWCQQRGKTVQEFFMADSQLWDEICHLDEKARRKLVQARGKIAEQVALAKELRCDNIHMLTILDEAYPDLLKSVLQQSPPVLFFMGNLQLLQCHTIAIIGCREASDDSISFSYNAARFLVENGVNVISGYARGIDRAAYDGATSLNGRTTIVLPSGINTLSNVQMQYLLPLMEAGNVLLLSQFHPDAPWLVSRAMARNKVVTALSQIVIVAEANMQGGTWDAAQSALVQNKPLYIYCAENSASFPANQALIERGGQPLHWSIEKQTLYISSERPLSALVGTQNDLGDRGVLHSSLVEGEPICP